MNKKVVELILSIFYYDNNYGIGTDVLSEANPDLVTAAKYLNRVASLEN